MTGKSKTNRSNDERNSLFYSIQKNLLSILEILRGYMAEATHGDLISHTDAVAPPKDIYDVDDEEIEVDFINDITFLSERIMSNLNYSIDQRMKASNAKKILRHFQNIKRNLRPAPPSYKKLQKIVLALSQIESMISEVQGNTYIV
ncbi:MAG TPA: hypothetical protein VJ574_02655 [Candidatus Bathyarchaeia archaeon]|nr:hypothetical protein [Candidatus Bathyarchaeia archaeon]